MLSVLIGSKLEPFHFDMGVVQAGNCITAYLGELKYELAFFSCCTLLLCVIALVAVFLHTYVPRFCVMQVYV